MDISFNCDKCGQHIVIDEAGAGMTAQCPKCQAELVVPLVTTAPVETNATTNTPSVIPNTGAVRAPRNSQGIDGILARADKLTLHDAVMQDDRLMVALLITKGADVNAKDDKGMTPLDLALAHDKKGIAELLVVKGAESTSAADRLNDKMIDAMILCDKAAVEKLLAEGADLNDALNTALLVENSDMARLLVALGAVPISIDSESFHSIPLHDAVFRDDMATVEKLIAEGADVNKRNELKPGMTALDWALIFDKGEIAKLLIEKGAAKAEWLEAQEVGSDGADEQGESENRTDRYIPDDVKDAVWRRDEGRCVKCKSNEKLEFDHIIPVSKGGSNTKRNVQLLCEKCNREKRAEIA